jgi:cephalosporin-C deacetylase-like acetyl esterase
MCKGLCAAVAILSGFGATGQSPWKLQELFKTPQVYKVNDSRLKEENGIKPLYYQSVPYRGRPTKVFAWYGVPQKRTGKLPGIILVQGGGGTAYKSWVQLWVDRGYAVIAMDTSGCIPIAALNKRPKWLPHDSGGPVLRTVFGKIDLPVEDQWPYHAVAAVILANSLLRSMPEVDPDRIGITGISWGGYLTNIVAGLDNRFRFAAPVYGCGFLGDNSSWKTTALPQLGPERAAKWLKLWDPSNYVGKATMPMLFCNGTNDKHYRPDSWQKTYRLVKSPRQLAMRVRMRHAHPPAGDPPEITVFADSIVKDGKPLPEIIEQGKSGLSVWGKFKSKTPIVKGVLNYTSDSGCWTKRKWKAINAKLASSQRKVTAKLPSNWTAYYFNIYDKRGFLASSEHQTK